PLLDHSTSAVPPGEADEGLGEMRRLADAGELTVILITHKLREVMEFAQDVTILRGGKVVARIDVADASEQRLAAMMFGQSHNTAKPELASRAGLSANYLEIEHLHALGDRGTAAVAGASLAVRSGEIVGIAGVSGNGQKELLEVLPGHRAPHTPNLP